METNQTTTTNKDMGDIMIVLSTSAPPFIITTDDSSDATAMTRGSCFDLLTNTKVLMLRPCLPQDTHFAYSYNRDMDISNMQLCLQNPLTSEETFLYVRPI